MSRDKKRIAGNLHFVLSAGIGRTEIATDVTAADLQRALTAIGVGA
jgi:3-dehydroquinate synthetase